MSKRGFAADVARMEPVRVNGLPGFMLHERDGRVTTLAFDLRGGRIATIYAVLNPEKTAHLVTGTTG